MAKPGRRQQQRSLRRRCHTLGTRALVRMPWGYCGLAGLRDTRRERRRSVSARLASRTRRQNKGRATVESGDNERQHGLIQVHRGPRPRASANWPGIPALTDAATDAARQWPVAMQTPSFGGTCLPAQTAYGPCFCSLTASRRPPAIRATSPCLSLA